MGKYLLLIAGVLVVYWLVRAGMRRRMQERQGKEPKLTDDMVRCAQCGVHLPRGDSLMLRGKFYCCDEHRRRDEAGD